MDLAPHVEGAMTTGVDDQAGRWPEASRRTHFAQERTLLAWWRTGIGVAAVALGIGGLVPKLSGLPKERFILLGVGYGVLALIFVIGGSIRDRASRRALASNDFAELSPTAVTLITSFASILIILTVVAFL